jgi:hypothetical protein
VGGEEKERWRRQPGRRKRRVIASRGKEDKRDI